MSASGTRSPAPFSSCRTGTLTRVTSGSVTVRDLVKRKNVTVKAGKAERVIRHDEQPGKAQPEKIPTLKPAG